jgi:excinuclease ABC subunit C
MNNKLKEKIRRSPRLPGVYWFSERYGSIIYVGKAKDLRARLLSYKLPQSNLLPKTALMVSQAIDISYQVVPSELDAILLEAKMIRDKLPKYNSNARDDKHPLYIKITSEKFSKVLTCRKEDDNKSSYYGPFPSSGTVRAVLRLLRSIFPYCSQPKIGRRPCFYSHIGLCNPCPSVIVRKDDATRVALTKKYRSNIMAIKKILSGQSEVLIKTLTLAMKKAATYSKFEEAASFRDKIIHVRYINQKPYLPQDLLSNPNLPQDKASKALEDLRLFLVKYFPGLLKLRVIEAYDIANIQGKFSVGSQVTFTDGIPDRDNYRRYRVRVADKPNDVLMLSEVLSRRLRHTQWAHPDLMIVDGGKPQLSSALNVISDQKFVIPVIGIAKREEDIVIPTSNSFQLLRLPKESPALHLVQQVRDEAHRFAQSYHHLLMRKRLKEIDTSLKTMLA